MKLGDIDSQCLQW